LIAWRTCMLSGERPGRLYGAHSAKRQPKRLVAR
jgi:hypothetical protein